MGLIFTDIPTDCAGWLDVAVMPIVTGLIGPECTANPG